MIPATSPLLGIAFMTLHLHRAVPIYVSRGEGNQKALFFDRWRARVFDESGKAKRITVRIASKFKRGKR